MADLAASDVTYTKQDKTEKRDNFSFKHAVFKLAFGDGSKTYPSGGIPLTKADFGMPNAITEFYIMDADDSNGLVYKYDYENEKIRIYEGDYAQAGDAELAELDAGSDAPAAATLYVKVVGW